MNKVRIFKNVYEICSFKTKRPFEIFILLICSKFCVKAQKPILEYLMNEAAKKIKNWFELLLFRSKFHWCIFIESSKNYQNTILFELLNEIEMSWIMKMMKTVWFSDYHMSRRIHEFFLNSGCVIRISIRRSEKFDVKFDFSISKHFVFQPIYKVSRWNSTISQNTFVLYR